MEQDSLRQARELLSNVIENSEINQADKIELLINLYAFLNGVEYNNNIKILQKELERRKYNGSDNKGTTK